MKKRNPAKASLQRRSKKERRANSHSFETQERVCVEAAKRMGWSKPRPYVDDGVSGDEILREGLIDLLLDIYRGKIDGVVCYALDRLARETDEVLSPLMSFFKEHGIKIYFDDIGRTDDPDLLIPIIGAISARSLKNTKRRTRGGMKTAKAKGSIIGTPPAGYRMNEAKTRWVFSEKGRAVKRGMDAGKSMGAIAKKTGIPIRSVSRMASRIKAMKDGSLKELLKAESKAALKREQKAEARRKDERKLIKQFLIDPPAYEAKVRAALADMRYRKVRYGHKAMPSVA